MLRTQQIFEVLKTISSKRPFRTESISAAVGTPLQLNPSESNQYFQIYNGGDKEGGLFSNVEVRIPTALAKTKGGIVILTLNTAGPCVKRDDIMDLFGKDPGLSLPSPHGPADLPIYLTYPFDWGELRFGFPQRDRECLSTIVLDATRTLDQDQAR